MSLTIDCDLDSVACIHVNDQCALVSYTTEFDLNLVAYICITGQTILSRGFILSDNCLGKSAAAKIGFSLNGPNSF